VPRNVPVRDALAGKVRRVAGRAARRAGLRSPAPQRGRNGRIAFVGPMPPARTGIATYDRAVLDGLVRIGFLERHPVDVLWPVRRDHLAAIGRFDVGIYQLGNNVEHHRDVYRLAWSAPGIVVLHDLALDDFIKGLQSIGDPLGFRALGEAAGMRDRVAGDPDAAANEPLRVPWAAAAVRAARGVVVHAEFGRRYLQELGCRTPVFVIPHPAVESPHALARARDRAKDLRARLAARGADRLVVAPGDVNATKQHGAILAALGHLPDDVHLAIVGRRGAGYDVGRLVDRLGLGDRVTVGLDVPDEDFLAWIAAADVVVDLRHPHRGEVSGSLARSMQAGRPTIVSGTGTYLDVPEDTVVRVAPGRVDPEELRSTLARLLDDAEGRERIGAAASAYVRRLADSEATAHGYEQAILATRELLLDPTRTIMHRWARALAEVGVDEPLLEEGYGMSYARALMSFTSRP
jgi:glycosyltransferase involved in cell wall biosynthesis